VKEQRTGGSPLDWLFLALANQKVGYTDRARAWLGHAARTLDRLAPAAGKEGPGAGRRLPWYQRLEYRLLLDEADDAVNRAAAPPGASAAAEEAP
jgi:hypothetical protein